jgi:hypothetical protein
MTVPRDPTSEILPLCHAIDLLIAHLTITGSREELISLHIDLRPLGLKHHGIRELAKGLLKEHTPDARWRAYNRAKVAAVEWAELKSREPCPP